MASFEKPSFKGISKSRSDFLLSPTGKAKPKEIEHSLSIKFPGIHCQMSHNALQSAVEQQVTETLSTTSGCTDSKACMLKEVSVPECGWTTNQRTRRSSTGGVKIMFSVVIKAIDSPSLANDIEETSEAVLFQMQYAVSTGQFRISLAGMNSTADRSSFQHLASDITCNPGFVKSNDLGCGKQHFARLMIPIKKTDNDQSCT